MIIKPPTDTNQDVLHINLKPFSSQSDIIKSINKSYQEYDYWDKIKEKFTRSTINPQEAWKYIKTLRIINSNSIDIRDENGSKHSFTITNEMIKKLQLIDSKSSGRLSSFGSINFNKEKYLISSLSEEAIASSQLEGASTTRKVAKDMILTGRRPKTHGETMILNNYHTMESLLDWRKSDMSKDLLLKIQSSLTKNTIDEIDTARFRNDKDEIVIKTVVENQEIIVHTPPKEIKMYDELQKFIDFANDEDDYEYIHPVVKASILHYWFSYIHPFCDGNGRSARAIFYWYLMRHDYWLFQYLSVSKHMKNSKKSYDRSYLKVQYDNNDLGYFIMYSLEMICKSINEFENHLNKWISKEKNAKQLKQKLRNFNERQIDLLQYLYENHDAVIDIKIHQNKHGIVYQTARTDLLDLADKNLLQVVEYGKKLVFTPKTKSIELLLAKKHEPPIKKIQL